MGSATKCVGFRAQRGGFDVARWAAPRVPIIAFTPNQDTYQRLAFLWGVRPQQVEFVNSLEEMLYHVEADLLRSSVVQPGDQVVMVCGFPVGAVRPPNMALLHTIGE